MIGINSYSQESSAQKIAEFNRLHDITVKYQSTNLDSSRLYMDSCLALAKEMRPHYYFGKALQLKTRGEFYEGEIDSSIVYGNQSLEILKEYPDSLEFFFAEYNQGNMFLYREDNIQALVQFKKAAKIIDEHFDVYVSVDREQVIMNRAYCHASIAMVLLNLEDFSGSIRSFKKVLKITDKIETYDAQMLRSVVLGNLGAAYFGLGDYDATESLAIASMDLKKSLGQNGTLGYSFQILSDAAYGRGKYKLCLRYLDESDKKFEVLDTQIEIDRNNFKRAVCYLALKNADKAIELLSNLEETYRKDFPKKDQADLYEQLANAYQLKGDFELANDYFRITLKYRKDLDVKNDRKIVNEFINFFEKEEDQLNHKIQNLRNVQEKEKLELQIEGESEKKIWIYTLFLVSIVCLILVILVISSAYRRNKRTNVELSESIDENKILFKEVHHRVKNNFQIISSLLNLQHGIEEDERGKKVLTDAQGRIQSMSLVHEMLYRKSDVKKIDFDQYAGELVDSIIKSFTKEDAMIEYSVKDANCSFDLEVAVPLGLILNEAITNAVKYAFNDLKIGKIDISLDQKNENEYQLVIRDNGAGIPEEYINGNKETLGVELINILSEQLGGKANFKNEEGAVITIEFKS